MHLLLALLKAAQKRKKEILSTSKLLERHTIPSTSQEIFQVASHFQKISIVAFEKNRTQQDRYTLDLLRDFSLNVEADLLR